MDEKIVYIIVAIIWIVSSVIKAVGKNSKKAQTPKPATQNPSEHSKTENLDDFKKILEEIITGKQTDIFEPKAQPQTVKTAHIQEEIPIEKNKYSDYQGNTEYEFNKYSSLEDTFDTNYSNKSSLFESNEVYNYDEKVKNNYEPTYLINSSDLRTAIIYSEILKRPNY